MTGDQLKQGQQALTKIKAIGQLIESWEGREPDLAYGAHGDKVVYAVGASAWETARTAILTDLHAQFETAKAEFQAI